MYRIRERDPSAPCKLWELYKALSDQWNAGAPTPKYTWSAGGYKTQTDEDPCVGFKGRPSPASRSVDIGENLKPTELVAWTLSDVVGFDDLDGNLALSPCPEEEDKVWIECPRQL